MKILFLALAMLVTASSCHSTPAVDSKTQTMNNQGILTAINKKDISAVEKALKDGISVNTADNSRRSLLLIATNNKDVEMIKLLVKHGADVNQQADNLDTPFLFAGASGQTEIVQLFLDNGARFDIFNRYNGSALIPACERGHVETVRLLANTKNYPVDHVNRLGWTGLMEAIVLGDGSKKYQEIVQILKDAGARMDIPDNEGITPLQHAEKRGFKEIAAIIRS